MGLPLFIAPVEPEVASKVIEKNASGPRSAIRRQRTLRGPNARPTAAETRRRRLLISDTTPEEYEIWEMHRRSPPNDGELSTVASFRERGHRIFEVERMRARNAMRDTLSFERQTPPDLDVDGPSLMPPVPETRDYYAIGESQNELNRLRQRQDLRRLARNPAPTPPYTDADLTYLTRSESETPRTSSLTPALSPLRRFPSDEPEATRRRHAEESELISNIRSVRGYRPASERPTRSTLSERVHAVNRNSMANTERERYRRAHRVARLARQGRLDGLGDRDRSLSPEREASTWDTLLTGITPDPQPPSAGSSFASASAAVAAASSSSSSATTSTGTSMTSMGASEENIALRECDISEDSGSNTEEDEDIYEDRDSVPTRGFRGLRSYAEAAQSDLPEDLTGMHRIISHLAESDDIPESWWASAGLNRRMREPAA
ncbi:hypothetical protein BGZ60DRAFT_395580 [Tricladium varicosporioides]|nr:hypothetical protein BGZ60DRAFT_395580 [Hymenoscyphus varicosporioides]